MTKNIVIKSNENIVLPILWLGKETSLSYNIFLAGNGAKITLPALLLGENMSVLDLNINIYHQKPGTFSKIIVKGTLDGRANVRFNGLVKIEPGAKNADASLAAHILLLSDKTKAEIIPSLEISEKDIKAGHAVTISRINDMELFYLMSRGLSKTQAASLIINGFLTSILNQFPQDIAKQARKKIKITHPRNNEV